LPASPHWRSSTRRVGRVWHDFALHQRIGWLVQVASLLTLLLTTVTHPFKVSRLAILLFVLACCSPVWRLPRASCPSFRPLSGHGWRFAALLEACAADPERAAVVRR
jgi:hypothetical protein